MTDAPTLYEQDFVAWTEQQAEALRALSHAGMNQSLDWENLAEEVEDLGKSVRRELRNQLTRILHHLLKLQYSAASDPRRGWRNSVREARSQIATMLKENPSLRNELGPLASEQLAEAVKLATADLDDYGELRPSVRPLLVASTFSVDQIVGDWFPVEPDSK